MEKILKIFVCILFLSCGCGGKEKVLNLSKRDTSNKPGHKTDSVIQVKTYVETGSGVVTKLSTDEKIISLTFDACETKSPAYFDEEILSYLTREEIPFTLFVSGKFAKRNSERLKELSSLSFVEIENHSLNHFRDMERLPDEKVKSEVLENEKILSDITGKKTKYFRFPGGNYNLRVLEDVESLGYTVVHWRIPSGDPDKRISAKRLGSWVMYNVQPGDILIFHINGRGYKTAEALPVIVRQLKESGYRFVKLDENN